MKIKLELDYYLGNLTKQPAYIGKTFKVSGNLQNTDFVMQNTFWIGLYPALGEEELSFVANTIKKLIKNDLMKVVILCGGKGTRLGFETKILQNQWLN